MVVEPIEGRFCGACAWELLLRRQWTEQGINFYRVCTNPDCQAIDLLHVEPLLREKAGEKASPAAP